MMYRKVGPITVRLQLLPAPLWGWHRMQSASKERDMKHILIALTLAISAFASPALALSIADGQAQHAALKAQGYSFSNPDLNTSIGTLKTPGNNLVPGAATPSTNENVNVDEPSCGYWDTVTYVGGELYCIPMGEFTDSFNRGHDRGPSTGGPLCTTKTVTFTLNPVADRAHAVNRSDTTSTSAGIC